MLNVHFTQDSEVEYLFSGVSSGPELSLFFSDNLFSFWFEPVQDDFPYDVTRINDKTDGSAEL